MDQQFLCFQDVEKRVHILEAADVNLLISRTDYYTWFVSLKLMKRDP